MHVIHSVEEKKAKKYITILNNRNKLQFKEECESMCVTFAFGF